MPFTAEQLAIASGTDVEEIRALSEAGLLRAGPSYEATDAARVRLLVALEGVGVAREQLGAAVAGGSLSLEFIDALMTNTAAILSSETQTDLADRTVLPQGLVDSIRASLGTATASGQAQVRTDDARVFEIAQEAREMGASDEQISRIVRVTADSARLLTAAQRDFIDEALIAPALAATGSELEAIRTTADVRAEYRELGIELFQLLYARTVETSVFQSLVELAQRGLARQGLSPPVAEVEEAIAFVDVSGFTNMTKDRGDQLAAEVASSFAGLVQEVASLHAGRTVKLLGDGAMVQFPDAPSAVSGMLALVHRAEPMGLPPLHCGIDAGQLIRRDGDVFGTVVNVASRAGGRAGPGEILVTRSVVTACQGTAHRFEEIGEVELRGLPEPVALFRATGG